MSFYRTLLATLAATALIAPAFAEDNANANSDTVQISQSADGQSMAATTVADNSNQQMNAAPAEAAKINLNKATAQELTKLKGLNAAKARAIVAYRKKHGDFKSLDELAKVKGFKKMNPEKLKDIQNQLTIEG